MTNALIEKFKELHNGLFYALNPNTREALPTAIPVIQKYLGHDVVKKNKMVEYDTLLEQQPEIARTGEYGSRFHVTKPETKAALAVMLAQTAREIAESGIELENADQEDALNESVNLDKDILELFSKQDLTATILTTFPDGKITAEAIADSLDKYTL